MASPGRLDTYARTSSACTVMRTGVRKATLSAGVERVAVLVAGGHGRRTAPVALARCRAPSLNRSSSAQKSLCAARRRHMTPHRVLVVQSNRPLRVAMGHMSDALRSRNSASLAQKPASGRQNRLDVAELRPPVFRPLSWVVDLPGFIPVKRHRGEPGHTRDTHTGKKTPGGF